MTTTRRSGGRYSRVSYDRVEVSDTPLGDPGADLAKTMIAVQKADLALRTTVAVQNKLVGAYQDIMNMSV